MATRFYLESSGTDPVSTTFDATTFNNTSAWSPVNLPLNPTGFKKSTTITNKTFASVAGGNAYAGFQAASPPLNGAQSVSGTISGIFFVLGISANDNYAVSVGVYQANGTLRGTLIHSTAGTGVGTVWATSAQATSIIWSATAITTVAAQDGDVIVLQIGGDTGAITGSRKMQIGSGAASDYALTNGLTTNLNPWIEISSTLAFKSGVSNQLMMIGCGL